MPERIDQLARDLEMHAKSISGIVTDQREHKEYVAREFAAIDKTEAVRAERNKHMDERLDRIEESIRAVYGLGKWLLAAVGSTLLVALIGFVLKGGLFGP